MSMVTNFQLKSNNKIKINFNGGDLSSDSGLFLIKEFAHKIGFHSLIKSNFKTNDKADRFHKDEDNLYQKIYQIIAGYFTDDNSDELCNDPVLKSILDKDSLASQPTLSRFFNRMDQDTYCQLEGIHKMLRKQIYSLEPPKMTLWDLDSTLLPMFGNQENNAFNYHYHAKGYHPLVCYDGLNGDLLKIQLRNGAAYSSTGVTEFLAPLFDEYITEYPETEIYLRGDSGFATPSLFDQAEENCCSYAIRLKSNSILHKEASYLKMTLDDITTTNKVDYSECYGEFMYKAASWKHARRVICKVEKPRDQFDYRYTFIVTNMSLPPQDIIKFYCNRGRMENFIKESKNGFNFKAMSSSKMSVNSNRLQLCMLAYNLFNWFRRLVLPLKMRKLQIETLRLKLIKIAGKIVHSGRYITFKLCSSCAYKREFFETLSNISKLYPKLE